jgi:hypothetical protein
MKVRAALGSLLVLAVLGVGSASAPAVAADGLQVTTGSPTTGLEGGETVVVEVSGLAPDAAFKLGQCADAEAATCAGDDHVADGTGALTVEYQVSGWTFLVPETGRPQIRGCRPPGTCHLVAWTAAGDAVAEQAALALTFTGSQIEATFTPTTDLIDEQMVTITGRAGGAAGRAVEVRQIGCYDSPQGAGCMVDEVLDVVFVEPDDTFTATVKVLREPTRNGGGTFDCSAPTDGVETCELFAFVQEPDGQQDESRGSARAALSFRRAAEVRIIATALWEGTGGRRSVRVPLRLTAPQPRPVWVTVRTVHGTALAPSDYTTTQTTVRFAAGQTQAHVSVPIVTDRRDELEERFYVRGVEVSGGGSFAWTSAAVRIIDDD